MKHQAPALALLAAGTAAQFLWRMAPPDAQGHLWNATRAGFGVVLLALLAAAYRSAAVWAVLGLLAGWELMTVFCSTAWLVRPWVQAPGEAQCSSMLRFPVGVVSAAAAAAVAAWLSRSPGSRGRS